jgi:hypothetical protein
MDAMTVNVAQNSRGSSRLKFRDDATKTGPFQPPGGGMPDRENRLPLDLRWPQTGDTIIRMDDQNENPQRYQWPWFVLAAFLLAVTLAIVWMSFAVHREKQERDVNAPLPGTPAR